MANKNDKIEWRIHTENSAITVELGGSKYVLGMDKSDTHSTFNIGFQENFKYDDVKLLLPIIAMDVRQEQGLAVVAR